MNLLLYSFVLVIHFLFPGGESIWMEFFELIIFEGDLYQRGEFQADNFFSLSLSLFMKNFEELGFSQVFMENKWNGE